MKMKSSLGEKIHVGKSQEILQLLSKKKRKKIEVYEEIIVTLV